MSHHKATLRVFSDELSLEELTAVMGLPSSGGHTKGESKKRSVKSWSSSYWPLESKSSSEWVEDHIEELVNWLESKSEDYARIRSSCFADLFCLVATIGGQAGVVIHRDLMPRLIALGLSVVLDIHDGGEPEEEQQEIKPATVNQ